MKIFGYEITKIKEKYVFNGTEYETEFLMRAAERKENKRQNKLRLIEILSGFEHIHASLPKYNCRNTEISIIGREHLFRGERNIPELAEILIDNWTEINYLMKTLEHK